MTMEDGKRYRQIVRYLSESPWAILPSTLMVIRQLVAMHMEGHRLTPGEIEERIANGRARPDAASAGSVAVIPLWGVLVPHAGMMVDVSQPGTGLDAWVEGFRQAADDPQVSSILLHVDSPGGSADLVTEVAAEVRAARSKKEVVAVASTMAASAAYAIASQASSLLVTPSGMVGSIGVYMVHEDLSKAMEAKGILPTVVQAPDSGFKAERLPFGPLSSDAQAHMQTMVDSFYKMFVSDVARGRGVSTARVESEFGRGQLLTAEAALAAGMVDGIATYEEVLARMVSGKPVNGARQLEQIAAPVELVPVQDTNVVDAVLASVGAPAEFASVFANGPVTITDVTGFQNVPGTEYLPSLSENAEPEDGPGGPSGPGEVQDEPPVAPVNDPEPAAAPAAVPENDDENNDTHETTTKEEGRMSEPVSIEGKPPTIEELAAHMDILRSRMRELDAQAEGRMMSQEEQAEFDGVAEEIQNIDATIKNLQARKAYIKQVAEGQKPTEKQNGFNPPTTFLTNADTRGPDNIYDLSAYRSYARSLEDMTDLWRDGAKRANEQLRYDVPDADRVRSFVETLLAKDKADKPSESFSHRVLLAGNPAYDVAFGKMVMGRPLSTSEESLIKMAVSNTGLGSESPVPITIDPSVILTTDGSTNPLRAISRTVTITGNTWQGISTDGVTVKYEAELAVVEDQTPNFDAPSATVQKAHGWVEFSIEVDQDWGSFRSELTRLFQDAKDVKEADKFLFGTGSDEPEGLIFSLDDLGNSIIQTETANTLTLEDFESVSGDLPPRFDANARWIANKGVYQAVRSLAGDAGRIDVWVPIAQGFPQNPGESGAQAYTLLGYPTNVASDMSKLITTGDEYVAVLGDFSRGFLIIDRIGMNVELVPLVIQSSGRPRGSRGLYVYFRNTSLLLVENAFRILQIKHT